jgi:hypothetical protein
MARPLSGNPSDFYTAGGRIPTVLTEVLYDFTDDSM